ncbi:hypothetical protein ACFZAR_05450 [Streptomyces sp. NPDC008222]|uniref:hypothetical protein n=1 Tax=Streptomyces sp. NPDC008222 TaxID=3364820 RepID=UPI0036E04828
MTRTHQITCAHDDCPEWSITTTARRIHPAWLAAEHRARAAADGWTDVEGRDYCPDHTPTGVTR